MTRSARRGTTASVVMETLRRHAAQYDFIHCDKPGCWDDVLRAVGFVRRTPLIDAAPDLLAALQEIIADASCSAYAAQVAEAAIAKAVKLRKVRVNG